VSSTERLNQAADEATRDIERRLRHTQTTFERQRDELTEQLQQRLADADGELRRTLGAFVADAESERTVLEARLQELARRLDEVANHAALRSR